MERQGQAQAQGQVQGHRQAQGQARGQGQGQTHTCTKCRAHFTSTKAYNIHISVCLHRHFCKFCPGGRKEFDNFTILQTHLEKYHLFCEPCHWFAPSALGLRQHNVARHFVCVACGDYFINAHEFNGHAFRHRPRGVYCYCCQQDFSTLSAMYNHLESGNCPSGIDHEGIHDLAAEYINTLKYQNEFIFFCFGCRRPFRRMCDLLQHSETSTCGEGYWRGSGHVGSMVTYIANNIPRGDKLRSENGKGAAGSASASAPDNDSDNGVPTKPVENLPSIVISEAP